MKATANLNALTKEITPATMQKGVEMNEEAKKKENTKLLVWAVLILVGGFLIAKYTPIGKSF